MKILLYGEKINHYILQYLSPLWGLTGIYPVVLLIYRKWPFVGTN